MRRSAMFVLLEKGTHPFLRIIAHRRTEGNYNEGRRA